MGVPVPVTVTVVMNPVQRQCNRFLKVRSASVSAPNTLNGDGSSSTSASTEDMISSASGSIELLKVYTGSVCKYFLLQLAEPVPVTLS